MIFIRWQEIKEQRNKEAENIQEWTFLETLSNGMLNKFSNTEYNMVIQNTGNTEPLSCIDCTRVGPRVGGSQ